MLRYTLFLVYNITSQSVMTHEYDIYVWTRTIFFLYSLNFLNPKLGRLVNTLVFGSFSTAVSRYEIAETFRITNPGPA